MPTLRLTQLSKGLNQYSVEVAFERSFHLQQTAVSQFQFALSAQDKEDLRWYLEDFLQYPHDPAPKIANRIEQRIAAVGAEFFEAIFPHGGAARGIWEHVVPGLSETRVEIATGAQEAATLPWELLRHPGTDIPLALASKSFVHISSRRGPRRSPQISSSPIRILLAICRPGGEDDVPFRSVASRLLAGLTETTSESVQLDVLRPPTFMQLAATLRLARAKGEPYHIVHFDGHGAYVEGGPCLGAHGYLFFENPAFNKNAQSVDGQTLGNLLVETDIPLLILNACRSAHADPPPAPQSVSAEVEISHSAVQAFGSLAHEVMDAGTPAVIAMRYNVYVETAARFVADLYRRLTQGQSVGEAVSFSRKQLSHEPLRGIVYPPLPLQDWIVPVVYESHPMVVFTGRQKAEAVSFTPGKSSCSQLSGLPPTPVAGFFGRDETLLALDRAFDNQSILLLHGYAGCGKTATAAEFARWYKRTGGTDGPVLFTSFEQHRPLSGVLNQFCQIFQGALERAGIQWLALSDAHRRDVVIQVLKQVPVLWIWDNVESVAGFPTGASAWKIDEQRELADFLRDVQGTKAKFLLTSRRDERAWLAELPQRIAVPPMPFLERLQMVRGLSELRGRQLRDVEDWRAVLEFTEGNPLTITVVTGQILRDGYTTRDQIEAFVSLLRCGEASFEDEVDEGRTRSLASSLSYGFEHAFTETERPLVALLYLFQGFVEFAVLLLMATPDFEWSLPQIRGLTSQAILNVLTRAAEVGLLVNLGGLGYYSVHPALPWFLRQIFNEIYPNPEVATRSFVEAIAEICGAYTNRYNGGDHVVVAALSAEEINLQHVCRLSSLRGWKKAALSAMEALRTLYTHTGRQAEWGRLLQEMSPDFGDSSGAPLPGLGIEWSIAMEYRVRFARESRDYLKAMRLQLQRVDWNRRNASTVISRPVEELDDSGLRAIRNFAVSIHELAEIQRELNRPDCVDLYSEAYKLAIGVDRTLASVIALNLGSTYLTLQALNDFDAAEYWYQQSLNLCEAEDLMTRIGCLTQMGTLFLKRFRDLLNKDRSEEELSRYHQRAKRFYEQALDLTPPDAIPELAILHNQLGALHLTTGQVKESLEHLRKAISHFDSQGDSYHSGSARLNIASVLMTGGRLADAMEYARAALRNYEAYGERAGNERKIALQLIAEIERHLKGHND